MARATGLVLVFWVALVSCNLVHELAGVEDRALLVAEPDQTEDQKESIAEDEISALHNTVEKSLPSLDSYRAKTTASIGNGRGWALEAKSMVEAAQKLNQELVDRNKALRVERSKPPAQGSAKLSYGKVSGMQVIEGAKQTPSVPNSDSCELKCSMDLKCRSFSYNTKDQICSLSTAALGYSQDSVFYAKASGGKWEMYPGLYETSRSRSLKVGTTRADCEMGCSAQGKKCAGYSFKSKTGTCSFAAEPLHYDASWDYYEKPPREHPHGHPSEVAAEDMNDLIARETAKFWTEFQHTKNVGDKKKLQRLEDSVQAIRTKAGNLAHKLRETNAIISTLDATRSKLKRMAFSAVNAYRTASDEQMEAQSAVGEKELILKLVNQKIQQRTQQIQKSMAPPAEDEEEAAERDTTQTLEDLLADDAKMTALKERQSRDQQELQNSQDVLQNRQRAAAQAQVQAKETDRQNIITLTKLHNAKEKYKALKVSLKMAVTEALDVKKVIDREEKLLDPPESTLAPPSMHSQLSWDAKADEAEAKFATEKLAKLAAQAQNDKSQEMPAKQ
jgi:hypothetical protein